MPIAANKPGSSRSRRKIRRRLPPGRLETLLKSAAIRLAWTSAQIKAEQDRLAVQRRQVYGREKAIGGMIGGSCCSHAWADDVWHQGIEYPPGADTSGMVRCVVCKAMVPPIVVTSSGHCCDCLECGRPAAESASLPSSPALIVMSERRREVLAAFGKVGRRVRESRQ